MVNDHEVDRSFSTFQLEAQLLLHSSKDGGTTCVIRLFSRGVLLGCPFKMKVECASQTGFVYYSSIERL